MAEQYRAVEKLAWALEAAQGRFRLILARCNYGRLRDRALTQLQAASPLRIQVLALAPSTRHLFSTIQAQLEQPLPQALMVLGLESLDHPDEVAVGANNVREEFRNRFPFPLVLWVNDRVMTRLVRVAPDFESWGTLIPFAIAADDLSQFVQQTADRAFTAALGTGAVRLVENPDLNLKTVSSLQAELEAAQRDLQASDIVLTPWLEANLEFLLGQESDPLSDDARQHYERSLVLFGEGNRERGTGNGEWERGNGKEGTGNGEWETGSREEREVESVAQINYLVPSGLERQGCLLYHLGVWWRTRAIAHRTEKELAYQQAQTYFQQCIQTFEQAHRPDQVANFINALGDILQQLDQWDDLETIGHRALQLHQAYANPFRQARAFGFLTKVALVRSAWEEACNYAQQALAALDRADANAATATLIEPASNTTLSLASNTTSVALLDPHNNPDPRNDSTQRDDLEWVRAFNRSWYLFSLATAQKALGQTEDSLQNLEIALQQTKPYYEPKLYLKLLQALRDAYFERGDYLNAYQFKRRQRSIERQFNFRAFIGAGRLVPEEEAQLAGSAATDLQEPLPHAAIATEILAAGRQADVERLVERIGRPDCKVTVIYGLSGVGKSSLLNAGLVPTLKQQTIGTQDCLPVVMRSYRNWPEELERVLREALKERGLPRFEPGSDRPVPVEAEPPKRHSQAEPGNEESSILYPPSSVLPLPSSVLPNILTQLQQLERYHLRPVLIFDQFEEFFFVHSRRHSRNLFFEFLGDCLEILPLKVMMVMRRDRLHFLIGRPGLETIGNDILSKHVLYKLGNFKREEAQSTVQQLNEQAGLPLKTPLIDRLIADLAGDYNKVRPIELQIVGSQLETEGITTLGQYEELGEDPKQELVRRYLDSVVVDCGPENQRAAELVLYLLTDAQKIRPSKSQAQLEAELRALSPALAAEASKLVLVLDILVQSGLVFQVREAAADRYQLVHDYLASFIRKQQEPEVGALVVQLQEEREQRQQLELSLEDMKRERDRIQQELLAAQVERDRIQQEIQAAEAAHQKTRLATDLERAGVGALHQFQFSQLEALLSAVRAGQTLKTTAPDERTFSQYSLSPVLALQQILEHIQEKNRLEGHQNWVKKVNYSPDGHYLVTAAADDTARLWDLQGNQQIVFQGHSDEVNDAAFSPDGQWLATASNDGTARLWDLQGNLHLIFQGHQDWVTTVSFSPDGECIATTCKDGTVGLWDLQGHPLVLFQAHQEGSWTHHFSPANQLLATGSADKTIKLWDRNGNQLQVFHHSAGVWALNFSPDGRSLAAGTYDGVVWLWDLHDSKLLAEFQGHLSVVMGIKFSPDGQFLATVSGDNTARLWDLEGKQRALLRGHQDQVRSLCFSPDGRYLATTSTDRTTRLWDLQANQLLVLQGHKAAVSGISFRSDGTYIATASADRTARLWDAQGNLLTVFQGHQQRVWRAIFSPDGNYLATASTDRTARLWDLHGNQLIVFQGHQRWVGNLSFSPEGQILATASGDGTARLWDLDGQQLAIFEDHQCPVWGITFSPNGQSVATASTDSTARVWDLNGNEIACFQGHQGWVHSVSFSPDGQHLATASSDGTAKLWDLQGNVQVDFCGHQSVVWSVCFRPDGQQLATASADGTAKLWDLQGNQLAEFQGHQGLVWSACFSPDGRFLATASADCTARLWRIESLDQLLERACDWLQDYLLTNPQVSDRDRALCSLHQPTT